MTQIMEPGYEICHCKKVTFGDVEDALQQLPHFDDVQKITHCSTGCGKCHNKILDAISAIMMR